MKRIKRNLILQAITLSTIITTTNAGCIHMWRTTADPLWVYTPIATTTFALIAATTIAYHWRIRHHKDKRWHIT